MADKKVIAVTVVHRTLAPGQPGDKSKGISAKPPKVQVIQPKTVFMVSDDAREGYDQSEYDELLALGAIRVPDKDEKVEVSVENIVTDDAGGKATKTTKTTTKSGSGSTGKGSTASTGGEGKQSGDAKGAKAGEGPNQSGSGTTGTTGTTGDDLV